MRSGVTALVKSLSLELASSGVRVNNLMPGIIDTDRVASLDAARLPEGLSDAASYVSGDGVVSLHGAQTGPVVPMSAAA